MEMIDYIFALIELVLFITLLYVYYSFRRKIAPYIKKEYVTQAKLAMLFRSGLKKIWVEEAGWVLMNKQGLYLFITFTAIIIVAVTFSFIR